MQASAHLVRDAGVRAVVQAVFPAVLCVSHSLPLAPRCPGGAPRLESLMFALISLRPTLAALLGPLCLGLQLLPSWGAWPVHVLERGHRCGEFACIEAVQARCNEARTLPAALTSTAV